MARIQSAEDKRLEESRLRKVHWKRWGPYLSERQWGTVREDYSADGAAWEYFPHDHARSRAYRWGEDGIAGISDRHQLICFALALWNGRDPILKERLFGLTGNEGNHAEDVKECYFYLDNTPTHAYMKYLYKYPQAEFPYAQLVEENRRRGRKASEFELLDTGVFQEDRYFDVFVEYAKASSEDLLSRMTAHNRGPDTATVQLLPPLWFRTTWSWGRDTTRPLLQRAPWPGGTSIVELECAEYGKRWLVCAGARQMLFTENESNSERLWGVPNHTPFVKDGIHECIVHGRKTAVNPAGQGTKVAAHYPLQIGAGQSAAIRLRLTDRSPFTEMDGMSAGATTLSKTDQGTPIPTPVDFGETFDAIFTARKNEADEFYALRAPREISQDASNVQRQAFAGMLWSKQCYHYEVRSWLAGDPAGPPPPEERKNGRNKTWPHLYNADVISMPHNGEYPWYPAWALAFHSLP